MRRFAENKILENVVQPSRQDIFNGFSLKGKWNENFFQKSQPIVLELGCGKGEYSVGLAEAFPEKNFLGIDIKGARFWFGAKEGQEKKMSNIGFMRTQIELINNCFAENEVDEIWITFPDPQIKYRRSKHRLTHPDFLEKYKKILKKDGIIHLKTDSEFLHGYTLGILSALGHRILASHHDIYGSPEFESEVPSLREIKTYYESLFSAKGKTITYIRFQLKA